MATNYVKDKEGKAKLNIIHLYIRSHLTLSLSLSLLSCHAVVRFIIYLLIFFCSNNI